MWGYLIDFYKYMNELVNLAKSQGVIVIYPKENVKNEYWQIAGDLLYDDNLYLKTCMISLIRKTKFNMRKFAWKLEWKGMRSVSFENVNDFYIFVPSSRGEWHKWYHNYGSCIKMVPFFLFFSFQFHNFNFISDQCP